MALLTETAITAGLTALLTGATDAGGDVYDSRDIPWSEGGAFLALSVHSMGNRDEPDGRLSAQRFTRRSRIVVQAGVQGTADAVALKAAANQLCEQAKAAIWVPALPGGLAGVLGIGTVDTAFTVQKNPVGDYRRALGTIAFELTHSVEYRTVVTDDLEAIRIDVDLIDPGDGPDGTIDAQLDMEGLHL